MQIPEPLLALTGFVFAHATWSLSDLPQGECLVPLAVVEKAGQRQLIRFEAESQEEAIANGKATLAEHEEELDAWAFAREGRMQEDGEYVDVLTVEAKACGGEPTIVFVQRFQPFASGRFRLIGAPLVLVGGAAVAPTEAAEMLRYLMLGVQSHSKAASYWPEWSAQ
jgi:hypothetical protein